MLQAVVWYAGFVAALFAGAILLPAETHDGQPLADGTRRRYRLTGLTLFLATNAAVAVGTLVFGLSLAPLVTHFGALALVATLASAVVAALLYRQARAKGLDDARDWPAIVRHAAMGVELDPEWFGVDLKMFAYQPSLIGLWLLVVAFAYRQVELYGRLTPQMGLFQVFWWVYLVTHYRREEFMLQTWDIIAEKLGFALLWGDLALVPFFYSVGGWALLHQTEPMSQAGLVAVSVLFGFGLWMFRGSNDQKHRFKADPQAIIWGEPAQAIGGRLLVSGWWGIGRHLNYTGEITVYLAIALCAGVHAIGPFLLPGWLTALLCHRALRDERRCSAKYADLWRQYCAQARFRMFPLIYSIAVVVLLASPAQARHGVRRAQVVPLPPPERVELHRGAVPAPAPAGARPRLDEPAPAIAPGVRLRPLVAATPVVTTGALTVLRDTDLKAQLDTHSAVPTEPCAAKSGADVLFTDNLHAMVSIDGGATFGTVDPRRLLPAKAEFLGDQSVLYDPGHDLYLWTLLYRARGVAGGIRLAVAHGQADFEAGRFSTHTLTVKGLHAGHGAFDFPQMARSGTSLYVAANVFSKLTSSGKFLGSIVVRIPLADLAAATGGSVEVFHGNRDHFTFGLTQGATTTMYFAAHAPDSFAFRFYRWPEGQAVAFDDLPLDPYGTDARVCAGPDGLEWCGRVGRRIVTGWVAHGVVGFMWSASQMPPERPFPYVGVVRIDESTRAVLDQPDLYSTDLAIQFPSVGVNARGDLAGAVAIGGGARYPGVAAFVQDDLSGGAPTWELHELLTGTSGPQEDRWGDFFCTQPDYPQGNTWIMTGYVLRGGDASYTASHQHFLRVGRDRDVDCSAPDLCTDDGNSCTADACAGSVCQHTPLDDGAPCVDADACTHGETCGSGSCGGGSAPCAADGCGFESCVPAEGCVFPSPADLTGLTCRFGQDGETSPDCGSVLPRTVQRRLGQAVTLVAQAGAARTAKQARKRLLSVLDRIDRAATAAELAEGQGAISPVCLDAIFARLGRLFVDTVATLDQLP